MTTALVKPIDTPVRESGFWNDDVTGKLQQYSVFLTRAMEADERSFVLCVDATWGLGKTFFVKRWAKSLRDNEHKAVAELNGWQHDCSEDPLLPFVASITEQLQGCFENKEHCRKDKHLFACRTLCGYAKYQHTRQASAKACSNVAGFCFEGGYEI